MTRYEFLSAYARGVRDFRMADLREEDLREADLREADLSRTNLKWTDLRDTDLRWANLRDADLRWADLRDAKGIYDAGIDPRGYRFIGVSHADGPRIAAGCRWFTVPEAEAHWEAKGNQDALRRVAEIKQALNSNKE